MASYEYNNYSSHAKWNGIPEVSTTIVINTVYYYMYTGCFIGTITNFRILFVGLETRKKSSINK